MTTKGHILGSDDLGYYWQACAVRVDDSVYRLRFVESCPIQLGDLVDLTDRIEARIAWRCLGMTVTSIEGCDAILSGGFEPVPGSLPDYLPEYYNPIEHMEGVVVARPTQNSLRIEINYFPSSWGITHGTQWPSNVVDRAITWAEGSRFGVVFQSTNYQLREESTKTYLYCGGFGDPFPAIGTVVNISLGIRRFVAPRLIPPGRLWISSVGDS